MAAGRDSAAAVELLAGLDVPYVVAAPLLLQELDAWRREGVQGLQSVVLQARGGAVRLMGHVRQAGRRRGWAPRWGILRLGAPMLDWAHRILESTWGTSAQTPSRRWASGT